MGLWMSIFLGPVKHLGSSVAPPCSDYSYCAHYSVEAAGSLSAQIGTLGNSYSSPCRDDLYGGSTESIIALKIQINVSSLEKSAYGKLAFSINGITRP
jgi:hypothetical protein